MNFEGKDASILQGRKVLLVDDIPENLKLIGTILRKTGANLSIARNGLQGVEIAKAIIPDLILMDVNMPGLSGYDACEQIKEDETLKNIPLIFLTARGETEDMVRGYKLGAVDYITKPFDHTELMMKLINYMTLSVNTKKLEETNESLLNSDAAKNKFVSIISHDLRSPMGGILGLTKILVEEDDTLRKEERVEFLLSIYNNLQRQYEFMEDLLKWGNMQIGRYDLNITEVQLKPFLERIADLYQSNLQNKNIELSVQGDESITAQIDPTMFNSAIANIYSNCIKFTNQNGTIDIKIDDMDGMVRISIKDSGVGMEQVIADHIFDPEHFHTTKGTEKEGGSGLGMVLVGDMIKIHKGTIKANSTPGLGTEFIITMPKEHTEESLHG